jgi:hypothetical protein
MLENNAAISYILRIELLVMGIAMRGMQIAIRSLLLIGGLILTREIIGFALPRLAVF